LALLDAVPWPRTKAAAATMQAPFEGGTLLLESDASLFNKDQAFRREILPALPDRCRESGLKTGSVPGASHFDAEDGSCDQCDDSVLAKLVLGEPRVEKTQAFRTLLETFLRESIEALDEPRAAGKTHVG